MFTFGCYNPGKSGACPYCRQPACLNLYGGRHIKTDGVYSLARVENCTGWYWCSDYACGDLYEAEELFRDGHPVRQNRLIFVKYPEGRVVEPVKASEGQYFGAPVFYDGKLRILMVDFPGAVIRLLAYDDESGRTSQFAQLPLGEVSDCYNLMLKRSPLMLTRHGADDLFQVLWPERAEFPCRSGGGV